MGRLRKAVKRSALGILGCTAAAGGALIGASLFAPQVTVVLDVPSPTYDFTKTGAEITELSGLHVAFGTQVRGLTDDGFEANAVIRKGSERTSQGVTLRIEQVTYTLTASPWTVYVDEKYPEGSCEHTEVLKHENQHVAHAVQAAYSAAPAIKTAIERAIAEPVYAATEETAEEAAKARVMAAAKDAMKPFVAIRQQQDDALDSQDSYAATDAACHNW